MTTNDDWLSPAWYTFGNVFTENGFSKHSSVEFISNGSIGGLPHLFKVEFLNSSLIWSNSSALDTYFELFDSIGSIKSHLIICSISVFNPEIKVPDVDVEERKNQLKVIV